METKEETTVTTAMATLSKSESEELKKALFQVVAQVRAATEHIKSVAVELELVKTKLELVKTEFEMEKRAIHNRLTSLSTPTAATATATATTTTESAAATAAVAAATTTTFTTDIKTEIKTKTETETETKTQTCDFHIVGGFTETKSWIPTNRVFRYTLDKWREITPMLAERGSCAAVIVNDDLIVTGGYNRGFLSSVEAYNFKTRKWRYLSPMLTKRGQHVSVAINNDVYVIGGHSTQNALACMEIYDITRDEWRKGTSTSVARNGSTGVVHDGRIYVFGGSATRDASGVISCAHGECYDPATNMWTTIADSLVQRAYHRAIVSRDGNILLFGGDSFGPATAAATTTTTTTTTATAMTLLCSPLIEEYNPVLDQWHILDVEMDTPRSSFALFGFGDEVYLVGGEAYGRMCKSVVGNLGSGSGSSSGSGSGNDDGKGKGKWRSMLSPPIQVARCGYA